MSSHRGVAVSALAVAGLVTTTLVAAPVAAAELDDSSAVATTPAAAVDDMSFEVSTAWLDPSRVDAFDRRYFSVRFTFPPYDEGVGVAATSKASREFAFVSDCVFTGFAPTAGEGELTCTLLDEPAPEAHQLVANLKGDRAAVYDAYLAIEVCPSTGCSPLFALAATPAEPITVCAGESFGRALAYDFNLDWNASGATLGDEAPIGVSFDAGSVRDGGTFSIAGGLSEPGEYGIPIIVTDEFGGEHTTSVSVTAAGAASEACAAVSNDDPAPELADTGADAASSVRLATVALMLALAGALAVRRAARAQRGLSIR